MLQKSNAPILVLNSNTKRDEGKKARQSNIAVCKAIANIIRTTLGPCSMLKMLLDPMGGIVMTNDGHAILREIDVKHPIGKSLIKLARTQDEEVGDGTTSVIVLTGEMMINAEPFLKQNYHPRIIVNGYLSALKDMQKIIKKMAVTIQLDDEEKMKWAINNCIGTKFSRRWGSLVVDLAMKACRTVFNGTKNANKLSVEIRRFAKIEKIPGGSLEQCEVLDGVMLNKDIIHPGMRRHIKNPRILILDCPLEYKKGESKTKLRMTKEEDMANALK